MDSNSGCYRTPSQTWQHQRHCVECQVAQQRADMHRWLGATFAVIGKIALHPHTIKPHWFSIYSSLCSWNAAATEEKRLPESFSSSGSSCVLRKWCSWCKQEAGVDVYLLVCPASMCPGFICLALHVKVNDSCYGEGQETNKAQAGDHLLGWRAGRGEVALWHPSRLWFIIVFIWAKGCRLWILQKEHVMHLSAYYPPKARQPFHLSLPTLSTVI